ncbi:MAG: hypothetical protein L6R40_007301 [Gallowayella cf. fulva]|nr:MAG: hypothetical protein L6R40_007301 [Xanthomendoza cf. fulva]
MAQDTEQPDDHRQQLTADHIDTNQHHVQNSTNLRVSTNDSASDNDTSDRVREKLKKTSIATLPKTDAAALPSGCGMEHRPPKDDFKGLPEQDTLNQTPSPTSESRGRLSRKRSYDDSVEPTAEAAASPWESPSIQDDGKHARKRSRDVRAAQAQGTKSSGLPTEAVLQERESSSDEPLENDVLDREMEDSISSPRKKRSREDLDTDLHRGQKIAATEEARANRRSEDSERSQLPTQDDNGVVHTTEKPQQTQETSTIEASIPQQGESSTTEVDSIPSTAQLPSPQKVPEAAGADQAAPSKAPTTFATSGFAAMSGSSTSPFGAFGASKTSVFGSKPASNLSAAGSANASMNGSQKTQTSTLSTFANSASPFLSSASATSSSDFGISGAAAKPTGFGGSVFGSGFGNPTAGAPRLSTFAAPTSDVAIPKPTESRNAFGAAADDSAEEDGGSDADANPDEPEAEENETDSRFQQQEGKLGSMERKSI